MKTNNRFVLVEAGSREESDLNLKPTHEEISALAHNFYHQEGCPDGRADDHWFAAEGFLNREMYTR
jgi:hypothetical protein